MQTLLKPSQPLSKSKTEHARLDTPAAASVCGTTIIHRLNAFTKERETCIGSADGTEEVRAFVESFAQSEGYERTCELLDLAAMYKDYDIVDYEVYRELIATPSAANVIETGALQLLSPFQFRSTMRAIYLIDDAFLGVSLRYADLFDPVPTDGTDTRETGGSKKRDSWQSKTG